MELPAEDDPRYAITQTMTARNAIARVMAWALTVEDEDAILDINTRRDLPVHFGAWYEAGFRRAAVTYVLLWLNRCDCINITELTPFSP